MEVLALIGAIIVLIGSLFLMLAAIGLIRMPDVYNRMQAGTKATTLGTLFIALGLAFVVPASWPKLLILAVFILLTSPLSSNVFSRSAHYQGADPLNVKIKGRKLSGKDALAEFKQQGGEG